MTAPVELHEPDASWPDAFAAERALLLPALEPWLSGPIEHIGSTAVPGLRAKPIIDIMAGIETLAGSRAAIDAIGSLGYLYWPYKADLMHWFCKPSPDVRTHHLHLVPMGSRLWQERLAFRDRLRRDPLARTEYQALKDALALCHRDNREAYTEGKTEFVQRITRLELDSTSLPGR